MRAWLVARDPDLVAVRRAVRLAIATCGAFYLGRYLLDDGTVALYAAFTCVAIGGLSEISGTPRRRTGTMLLAAAVGAGLLTLGTYLSVSTVAATAGMVVVGFLVAFAGIGGPQVAGVANGWQLLYILPSFPPYDPGSLGSRLLGLGIGTVVLVVADRLLLPPPVPTPYRVVLADAVVAVGDRLAAVRPLMAGVPVAADDLAAVSASTQQQIDAARPSVQPMLSRPSGPSRHDRALSAAGSAARLAVARVDDLRAALLLPEGGPRARRGADLLAVAQECLTQCAAALSGGAVPEVVRLDVELARVTAERQRWLVDAVEGDEPLPERVAVGTAAHELAEAVRLLALAVTVAVTGGLPQDRELPVDRRFFWYADAGVWELGAVRLRGQLTLRSVWFRNAFRVALALGAARALAGVLDLSHGFWVLLATLTVMRTTFSAARTALLPAVVGTLVGAALAVPLLAGFGGNTVALAVLLPIFVCGAFAGGPLLGPAYGQVGFTLTVAALFAQVSPTDWSLAEWRLLDVLIGALVGVAAGLLAWPRGASGQLVAQCSAALLSAARALVVTTQDFLVGGAAGDESDGPLREARRSLLYAGETVGFAMAEPVDSGLGRHWRELLDCCHHMVEGGQYVRLRRQGAGPLPWPEAVDLLDRLARDDADRAVRIAGALPDRPGAQLSAPDDDIADWLPAVVNGPAASPSVLDVVDARGWLVAVRHDLDRQFSV